MMRRLDGQRWQKVTDEEMLIPRIIIYGLTHTHGAQHLRFRHKQHVA